MEWIDNASLFIYSASIPKNLTIFALSHNNSVRPFEIIDEN